MQNFENVVFRYEVGRSGEEPTTFPPVGRCIYCDSTGGDHKLGLEHIIPDGIGGSAFLPEASCRECEIIINRFEQPVQKTYFGIARELRGIRSSKKRKKGYRSRQSFIFDESVRGDKRVEDIVSYREKFSPSSGAISSHLTDGVFLEHYDQRPGIMLGARPDMKRSFRLVANLQPTKSKEPWEIIMFSQRGRLEKLLAKTAHAFACAHYSISGFRPYLRSFILDREERSNGYLIGSFETDQRPVLHRVALAETMVHKILPPFTEPQPVKVIVCYIHFFSDLATIAYQVVVGEPRKID